MSYEELAENHQWQEALDPQGLIGVNLFCRIECLSSARRFLRGLGYRELVLDCADATDDVHAAVRTALSLPDWFGSNWDAYYEAFEGGFGIEPSERVAYVITNAEAIHPEDLHRLIDGAACNDRDFLFAGGRLSIIVQTNDPDLKILPVGKRDVSWNGREWMDAHRRP